MEIEVLQRRFEVRFWPVASSAALQRYVGSWSTSRHSADIVNVRLQLSRLVYQQRSAQQLRQLGDVRSRVLWRRQELGLTQPMVAETLGVTFQQFQKYEGAINRISAGMLHQLSLTLNVPVQFFFEGLSGRRKKPR